MIKHCHIRALDLATEAQTAQVEKLSYAINRILQEYLIVR
jgi:hypothetical protein